MSGVALFETIPREDYLTLFPSGGTNYERVVDLLDFRKKDVARASNVALHSVRYDPPKMPKELQDRIQEWAVALNLVAQFFRDEHKPVLSFTTPNRLWGDIRPR